MACSQAPLALPFPHLIVVYAREHIPERLLLLLCRPHRQPIEHAALVPVLQILREQPFISDGFLHLLQQIQAPARGGTGLS